MSEEETEKKNNAEEATDAAGAETPVEETPEAPEATEAPAATEEAPAEAGGAEDPLADLPWKERRRLLRSRRPAEAKPARTPEERKAERESARAKKAAVRRRRREEIKTARKGDGTGTPVAERTRTGKPKERQGTVVSDRTDKTITVRVDSSYRHPVYEKIVRHWDKLHVHDERNEASEGDVVRVIETRKLSRTKHWRLVEIVEKAR